MKTKKELDRELNELMERVKIQSEDKSQASDEYKKDLSREELLRQLYAVKHRMERQQDWNVAMSKAHMLDLFMEEHPFSGFFMKRDMKRKAMSLLDNAGSFSSVIKRLDKESRDVVVALPSGLVTSREYVDAAIDDIVMGRANNVAEAIAMYEKRRDIRRESYEVQSNKMKGEAE